MGDLILCNQPEAQIPYYLEELGKNVYSLEEISYYIEQNAFQLDRDFMKKELCTWIAREMKLLETADQLQNLIYQNAPLSLFVSCILDTNGYCSEKSKNQILTLLRETENKSAFERDKIRADRYVSQGQYARARKEYRRLLLEGKEQGESPIVLGSLWHNMGTAYCRNFLFTEAVLSFQKAYELSQSQESLYGELMVYLMIPDEKAFYRVAKENYMEEEETRMLIKKMADSKGKAAASPQAGDVDQRLQQCLGAYAGKKAV